MLALRLGECQAILLKGGDAEATFANFMMERGCNMEYLSDKLLIDSYKKALDLDLNQDFIRVLEKELVRRQLHFSFKNIENID